jgi:1,6-anhydro-N-acetylmuramate kinase
MQSARAWVTTRIRAVELVSDIILEENADETFWLLVQTDDGGAGHKTALQQLLQCSGLLSRTIKKREIGAHPRVARHGKVAVATANGLSLYSFS